MPTFLVTPKMSPQLRERVAASVRGRRVRRQFEANATRRTALIRLVVVVVVAAIAVAVVHEQQTRTAQLNAAKKALLQSRAELRATLTPSALAIGERLTRALRHEANALHVPVRDESLRSTNGWDTLLARPLIYTRAEIALLEPPERLEATVSESRIDAFVACLKHPPGDRSEKELMKRVSDAYGSGPHEFTQNVYRAHDALLTLRLLDPAIDRQIERADELQPVVHFQQTWEDAQLDARLPAVFGEVFLMLLDEPKTPNTPVELDGASVHGVRVVIVDISREHDQVLLRSHHDLNPSWVSERRRHQYALGLEGCRLAYDLRGPVEPFQKGK